MMASCQIANVRQEWFFIIWVGQLVEVSFILLLLALLKWRDTSCRSRDKSCTKGGPIATRQSRSFGVPLEVPCDSPVGMCFLIQRWSRAASTHSEANEEPTSTASTVKPVSSRSTSRSKRLTRPRLE